MMSSNLPFISGPFPNKIMFIGEGPGFKENQTGLPFVGKAGQLQRLMLGKLGINVDNIYLTNLSKTYNRGNPDPSQSEIKYWSPFLLKEIIACRPKLIVSVGRISTQWLLGESNLKITDIHGVVHCLECFTSNPYIDGLSDIETVVIPIIHPASGLREDRQCQMLFTDYQAVARAIDRIAWGGELSIPTVDQYPNPIYEDLSGQGVEDLLGWLGFQEIISIDTEGYPGDEWSLQFCFEPGEAYMLRCSRGDFDIGIRAIQEFLNSYNPLVVMHCANTPRGCLYDVLICRGMGLDLSGSRIADTMLDAYLMKTQSQALKIQGWRKSGMIGVDYSSTVASNVRQCEYLENVVALNLGKPETVQVTDVDGQLKYYGPRSLSKRAEAFLKKNDTGIEMTKKWNKKDSGEKGVVKFELKESLDEVLGPIPLVGLQDVESKQATIYGCWDADATLRSWQARIRNNNLEKLREDGIEVLRIVEQMQYNGISIDVQFFEMLVIQAKEKLKDITSELTRCNRGQVVNTRSSPQVAKFLFDQGVPLSKETKGGNVSVSTPSIELLRVDHREVDLVLQGRELENFLSKFCNVLLQSKDENDTIRCCLAMSATSGRLTATNPNLLAIKKRRNRWGWKIREGFVCSEGSHFFSVDYSNQEMRFMAHLSQDETLCNLLIKGKDVHSEIGYRIFGVKNLSSLQRDIGKTLNFAILFGATAGRLAMTFQENGVIGWDTSDCSKLLKEGKRVYPRISQYKESVIADIEKYGWVESIGHLRRYLPNIWSSNQGESSAAGREGINHTIQGSATKQIQNAMIHIERQLRRLNLKGDVKWVLCIHDEVLFEVKRRSASKLKEIVIDSMVNHGGIKLRVPIVVDSSFAQTWGGL